MFKIRDLDSIASEAKQYDVTIVFNLHLRDAINIRSGNTFRRIAYIPMDIVRMESIDILKGMMDERLISSIPAGYEIPSMHDICSEISERTGYRLNYVFGEVRNIKNIRRYHGDASPYLCDPDDTGSKLVLKQYMKMPVNDRMMEYCSRFGKFLKGKKVAVIGKRYMSLPETLMIPDDAHDIELFDDSEFIPDKITLFRNNAVLAKNVASLIRRSNSRDTAIVVGRSDIRDAVIAEISRSSKVAIDARESMIDLKSVGDYLEFLETSKRMSMLRQSDVIELFSVYGISVSRKNGNRYLSKYVEMDDKDAAKAKELFDLMVKRDTYTFGELSKELHNTGRVAKDDKERIKSARGEVDDFLRKAGFFDRNATLENIQYLYDIVSEEDITSGKKDGLQICSPSDTYIDRRNIIYIGMGSDWTKNLSEIRYIENKKKEDALNAERFSILMQQGVNRIYVSTFTEYGRNTVPSNYFSPIDPNDCTDDFKKIFRKVSTDCWYKKVKTAGFSTPADDSEIEMKNFSKSSYSNYLNCRYRIKFKSAEDYQSEDQYLGTLIHAYAELRMHYPDIVKENGPYHYRDLVYDLYSEMSDPNMKEFDRRMIYQMIVNIDRFQDSIATGMAEKNKVLNESEYGGGNELMVREGLSEYKGEFTEVDYPMNDCELKKYMHGILDLLVGNDVWDYKTGKQKDAKDAIDGMFNYNDYQPFFYLLLMLDDLHDKGISDESPTFNLFFPKEYRGNKKATEGGAMVHFVIVDNITDLLKNPSGRLRQIFEEKFDKYDDTKNVYFNNWNEIIDSLGCCFDEGSGPFSCIPAYKGEKIKENMIRSINGVVNRDLNDKNYKKSLKLQEVHRALNKVISNGLYYEEDTVYVPRYILDAFYEKVKSDHRELHERIASDTLEKDLKDPKCSDCSYRDMCTISGGDLDV